MFSELTDKLETIFKSIKGQGRLTEANISEALRDIRRALLEADVNFRVAKRFIKNVEEKALGTEVLNSITPGQIIVKIVHDELIKILGETTVDLTINSLKEIIMICGLQGSGKTTSVAKLAVHLRKRGKKPAVASVDVHRPAAIEQLKVLAEKNNLPFYDADSNNDPVKIAQRAVETLSSQDADVLIMDTAGRLHIDKEMMDELLTITGILNPNHVLFVADCMTGQDAVNAVEGFIEYVEFDGVILAKTDGDARGGAALSIREVTGKPILFAGTGERIDAFEQFHPDRFASRILGMGDIVSLVEKAQDVIDAQEAEKLQKKITSEGLTLGDFLDQIRQMKKMGPLDQLLGMIPGFGKAIKGIDFEGDEFKHIEAIILSMTRDERKKSSIIDGSRKRRIANGSGTSVHEVNKLLKQFSMMQKMMKKMSKFGAMKSFRGMNIPM
ncbi:signal recognition particle protein [Candidatus Latescibacterota bacterium]